MKRSTLCAIAFAVLSLVLVAQQAQAQYAYGISAIAYDDQTQTVYGYSATEVDYYAGYYYDPYVEGFMYDQYNYWPIDSGSSRGYESFIDAEVYTYKYGALPNTEYDVISDHYVIAYWSTSVVVCDEYYYSNCTADYWYDPWGYSFFGGGNYGSPYWWWGNYYGGYVPERTFYLGTTGVGIVTPPDSCPLQTSAKSADAFDSMAESSTGPCQEDFTVAIADKTHDVEMFENVTKTALLDADVVLEARVKPSNTAGGYVWTISGDKEVTSGSTTSSTIGLRWTKEGSYTVKVEFTNSAGTKKSANLNVNVIVPTLDSFTATELTPQVNAAGMCFDSTRPSITLGCGTTHQNSGIQFAAKAKSSTFLLSSGGGLKYVQIASSYTKRELRPEHGGTIQCRTGRTAPDKTDTGWMLDDADPYKAGGGPYGGLSATATFDYSTGAASIGANDTPSETILTVKDYFRNDAFETYVVYYTGDDPAKPRRQRVIGKMAWNWQGHATYNAAGGNHLIDASQSIPTAQKSITGTAITEVKNSVSEIRAYQGRVQELEYKSCGTTTPAPGAPPRAAGFGSQAVTTTMEAGQVYNVSVTMTNNGSATWTINEGYKLGSQNPQDNGTWGTGRVNVPDGVAVPPGSSHTFNFYVTAPSFPGTYNFQWRMLQEGVEWFGDYTPNLLIDVVSSSSCDPWAEQNCYDRLGDWDPSTCQCFNVCNNWKCMGDYPYTY
ncbi:MAG TPA: NBR1-Ig-like domain-containing protein [Pyrinomonadaceae bacterium]|nr:NBR1-Ig-like domain-containing protein [Pyrinomonadaceae bacterium]